MALLPTSQNGCRSRPSYMWAAITRCSEIKLTVLKSAMKALVTVCTAKPIMSPVVWSAMAYKTAFQPKHVATGNGLCKIWTSSMAATAMADQRRTIILPDCPATVFNRLWWKMPDSPIQQWYSISEQTKKRCQMCGSLSEYMNTEAKARKAFGTCDLLSSGKPSLHLQNPGIKLF